VLEDLAGKVAIVAGGAGGLGSAQVHLLHSLGATVAVADLEKARSAEVADALGERASAHALDVRAEESWKDMVAEVRSAHGGVDILVNTFGITVQGAMDTLELDDYLSMVAVNQTGVFLGMKTVVPSMRERGAGSIINISSGAGISPVPRLFAYSAAKAAVIVMTKSAAMELGRENIRVNCICPGAYETPLRAKNVTSWTSSSDSGGFENTISRLPIPRVGQPSELAGFVAFLSSDASSYCTGGVYLADGGALAGRMS
jgi:3alpha(or 20beta)-hydroxysteroid dehydrogenase